MDSGLSGHHMDQSPVIFQCYSGPLSVRSVSRLRGAEVNSNSSCLRKYLLGFYWFTIPRTRDEFRSK